MPWRSTISMKCHGVKRASADLQKCGLAERKLAGVAPVLVKLQRPPPDIRIFLPTRLACSTTSTRLPRRPAVNAHISPAAPPPTIIASKCPLTWLALASRHRKGGRLEMVSPSVEGQAGGWPPSGANGVGSVNAQKGGQTKMRHANVPTCLLIAAGAAYAVAALVRGSRRRRAA